MNDQVDLKCDEVISEKLKAPQKSNVELEKSYKFYSCTFLLQHTEEEEYVDTAAKVDSDSQENLDDEATMLVLFTDRKLKPSGTAPRVKTITKRRANAQRKKRVFEFALVYKKATGKLGVRKFRIVSKNDVDKFSNPHLVPVMYERYAKMLINSGSFDKELFVKYGGIFNKKFWEINIFWGSEESFFENLHETATKVQQLVTANNI